MSSIRHDLIFLILQYLDEEKFKESLHELEQESGFFFNMRYFEETVLAGNWEEAERYLSGFTKFDDNRFSMKIFLEIRKQKYLEALDRRDKDKALDILIKDLKVFSTFDKDIVKELALLLSLENFREKDQLSEHGDIQPARALVLEELKKVIEKNPLLRDKLQFPPIKTSRLRTLINQSLNWQHKLCKNRRPKADIKTLFVDHSCSQPNDAPVPTPSPVMPIPGAFPRVPFQQAAAALPTSFAACRLKRPVTPPNSNPALHYHAADSGHVIKRPRPMGNYEETPAINQLGSVSAMAGTSASVADRGAPLTTVVAWNEESQSLGEVKLRMIDESIEKSKIWKLAEINESSQCRSLRLPDSLVAAKVPRLIYTNSGHAILALASNAVHKLWKWQTTDRNTPWKATTSIQPQLWQPSSGILMTNAIGDARTEDIVHCFALSKNDSYVASASGGKISFFNMVTFKTVTTFLDRSTAATFLAFHPQDNNIIVIGMEDSTVRIYNVHFCEIKGKLRGHQKRITGLAFSNMLNILVSSGADAQLCIWGTDAWAKQANKFLQIPTGQMSGPLSKTEVQFHRDQLQLLVVHDTQLAIYDAAKLECLKQWVPRDGIITHATYSCDSQMIYASFVDGSVSVFTAALRLRCRISPSAYLNAQPSSNIYPLVIAAHPSEPNQFALGLTDGGVLVLEPLESEGKWGTALPAENDA